LRGRCRLRSRRLGKNVHLGRWSSGYGCCRRRGGSPQALFYEFKLAVQALEFLVSGSSIAAAPPFDHPGINKRWQTHHQPADEEQQHIFHRLLLNY
jgi:hypothetical protein